MKKEKSYSRAYLVAFVLFFLGSLCGAILVLSLSLAVARSFDNEKTEVPLFITATPSPTPQQIIVVTPIPVEIPTISPYVDGMGSIIDVSVNWRLSRGVGISYFDGTNLVETIFCSPTPQNSICKVVRPPVLKIYSDSFAIVAWDDEGKYTISADITKPYIYINYGWENGVKTFFEE